MDDLKRVMFDDCVAAEEDVDRFKLYQSDVINRLYRKQIGMLKMRRDNASRVVAGTKERTNMLIHELYQRTLTPSSNLHDLFDVASQTLTQQSLNATLAPEAAAYFMTIANKGPKRWLYMGTHLGQRICLILNASGILMSLPTEDIQVSSNHFWRETFVCGEMCTATNGGSSTSSNDRPGTTDVVSFAYDPSDEGSASAAVGSNVPSSIVFVVHDVIAYAGLNDRIQLARFNIRLDAIRSLCSAIKIPNLKLIAAPWQKMTDGFKATTSAMDAVIHFESQLVNDAVLNFKHEQSPSANSGVAAIESKFPSFVIPSSLHVALYVVVLKPSQSNPASMIVRGGDDATQLDRAVNSSSHAPANYDSDCKSLRILTDSQWRCVLQQDDPLRYLETQCGCGCFWEHENSNLDRYWATSTRLSHIMSIDHDEAPLYYLNNDDDGGVDAEQPPHHQNGMLQWVLSQCNLDGDKPTSHGGASGAHADLTQNAMSDAFDRLSRAKQTINHKMICLLRSIPAADKKRGAQQQQYSSRPVSANLARQIKRTEHHALLDRITVMGVVYFRLMDRPVGFVQQQHFTGVDMIPVKMVTGKDNKAMSTEDVLGDIIPAATHRKHRGASIAMLYDKLSAVSHP